MSTGRRNRVNPDGTLLATGARGTCWGNRGPLLDERGQLARHNRGRAWVVCELEFRGRHRTQWQPGHLTELYFLDEATALAAGHRPCGQCRHRAHQDFLAAWSRAHPDEPWLKGREHLHRWTPGGYTSCSDLPRGEVTVLTPRSTVDTVAAGYVPALHPSART